MPSQTWQSLKPKTNLEQALFTSTGAERKEAVGDELDTAVCWFLRLRARHNFSWKVRKAKVDTAAAAS